MKFIGKYILVFTFLFTVPYFAQAQRKGYKFDKKQKSNNHAFPSPFDFRQMGWLFDAGLIGSFTTANPVDMLPDGINYSYNFQIRPGITLNAGGYYSLKKGRKIIRYIDATLGYKMLWFAQKQNIEVITSPNIITSTTFDYLSHNIDLNLNFNNVINLSNYTFLQNTLGINIDYRIGQTSTKNSIGLTQPVPNFLVQAHYKLGLGFMVDTDLAIIPYVEIPVLNITPSQNNFSQLDYFGSSFQSVIIGVRIILFRFGQKDCPKAINTDGKARNNGY